MTQIDSPVASPDRTPPRAPLAFRVGVVGHGPERLDDSKLTELATTFSEILSTVKDETRAVRVQCTEPYEGAHAVLKAVSSLANGSDQIFANAALALGFELCAILPFAQEEFERDFTPGIAPAKGPLDQFLELLKKAKTRFELDGTRVAESDAYAEAGLVVLNQSDLLIVVWDGRRLCKHGGTEDTLFEARSRGMTVAWIDALEPTNWQLLDPLPLLPRVTASRAQHAGSFRFDSLDRRLCARDPRASQATQENPGGSERQEESARQ